VAKTSKPRSKSDPPSAWAIVLVAAILILVPVGFCAGMYLTMQPDTSKAGGQKEELKIQKPKDAGGGP
jgi:hypothetical protein